MRRSLVAPLAAGLLVAAYVAALRRYGIFDFADEGLLLVQAWRAAHGEAPHLDFHTGYGPLSFRLQALLVAAGGLAAVRWALVAVHGATAALAYALARRLAGPTLAAAAVALEVAFFLPVAPGLGAPFNVPYPAWYAGLAGVALAVVLGGPGGCGRALVAGALVGAVVGIKPNSGMALAAGAAAAIAVSGGCEGGGRSAARGVLVLVAAGGLVLVALAGVSGAAVVLAPPLVALAAVGWSRAALDGEAAPRLAALAAAMAAAALAASWPSLAVLGPARFVREGLLVGGGAADVAAIYGLAFPAVAVAVAAAGLAAFLVVGARHPALVVAVAGVVGVVGSLVGLEAGPAGLRLAAERLALALAPLAVWGGLALLRGAAEPALAATTALGACAALQLFPRADLVHLMPLAPLLLPLVLRCWRDALALVPLPARAATALLVGVPLVAAAGRFAPTAAVLGRLALGEVTTVRAGAATLVVAPAGAERLEALAAAVAAVERAAPADAPLLAFPACGMVPFLAGRRPAGPHDYFFPGRPTREEVAALAARLAAAPPPVAVTCEAAGSALAHAAEAYPELADFIAQRYRPILDRPPFRVGVRRD